MQLPGYLKGEDLTPLPVKALDEVGAAFRGLGQGQVVEAQLPVVVN